MYFARAEARQPDGIETFAVHAMDVFDREGLHTAIAQVRDLPGFFERQEERAKGLSLYDVVGRTA